MSDDNPLMDRFEEHKPQSSDEDADSPTGNETASSDTTDNLDNTEGVKAEETAETSAKNSESDSQDTGDSDSSDTDTRRSRPHTAIYISEDLVEKVDDRYRKINGQLMIDGKEEIEKHKHFFEGLIKAGLDHDDLEEIVLNQRDR
ncbi:hypothetical protein ACFQL1_25335 [Halomicroarcula sp. GCM10025709]|uniref:hypothetical protein n=1 Tax=Haloarcula TaxID=2237 RepID=UPI0024C33B7A|nr:hypothetical protein [Halomicroarcula sp. YJ-61-S]